MSGQLVDPNMYAHTGVFRHSYQPLTYAGLLVATLYCGIFVMLNNHYVFRPKLQKYARKLTPSPKSPTRDSLRSLIVDAVLSLASLTFSLSSVLLSGSTNNVQCFVTADSIWMGLYASIILYRERNQPKNTDWKYALKNMLSLILGYLCLLLHIQLSFFFVTFGILLILVAAINQLTNIYYDKVERYIDRTFFREEKEDLPAIEHLYTPKPIYPEVQWLAKNFPVDEHQLDQMANKYHAKRNAMKLSTNDCYSESKAIVYEKLHSLYSRIAISLKKHRKNQDRKTMQYYGRLNGTMPNDKLQRLVETRQYMRKTEKEIQEKPDASEDEDSGTEQQPVEQPPNCLLYMFPIKMLEYTEVISVVFSLAMNIAYGILLDYTLQIVRTLPFGNVFNCVMAFTMLPLIPKTGISQLQGSMATQSVLRYGIVGITYLIKTVLSNSDGKLTLYISVAQPIVYLIAVQLGFCLYYCLIVLLIRWQQYKFLTLFFVGVVGSELYISILFRSYYGWN